MCIVHVWVRIAIKATSVTNCMSVKLRILNQSNSFRTICVLLVHILIMPSNRSHRQTAEKYSSHSEKNRDGRSLSQQCHARISRVRLLPMSPIRTYSATPSHRIRCTTQRRKRATQIARCVRQFGVHSHKCSHTNQLV